MKYKEGYKGKGMCKHCLYSANSFWGSGLYCDYCGNWCKLVACKCLGIKYIKNVQKTVNG